MNYPGKYKKMNSGKYLYKAEKKSLIIKKKTFKYFDDNLVRYIENFINKLSDIECNILY